MIQVAVMGYGTIGSGVVEVLETNKDKITEKTGKEIAVKYILDLREFPGDPHEAQIVHDFEIIEKDEDVEIVVEAMGGVNPAYKFAKACLLAGKHVVTSNKALVAAHGTELLAIAREKNLNFLFEASVGGGIPLLRPLTQSVRKPCSRRKLTCRREDRGNQRYLKRYNQLHPYQDGKRRSDL